jgi:hypothetical protein
MVVPLNWAGVELAGGQSRRQVPAETDLIQSRFGWHGVETRVYIRVWAVGDVVGKQPVSFFGFCILDAHTKGETLLGIMFLKKPEG